MISFNHRFEQVEMIIFIDRFDGKLNNVATVRDSAGQSDWHFGRGEEFSPRDRLERLRPADSDHRADRVSSVKFGRTPSAGRNNRALKCSRREKRLDRGRRSNDRAIDPSWERSGTNLRLDFSIDEYFRSTRWNWRCRSERRRVVPTVAHVRVKVIRPDDEGRRTAFEAPSK